MSEDDLRERLRERGIDLPERLEGMQISNYFFALAETMLALIDQVERDYPPKSQ